MKFKFIFYFISELQIPKDTLNDLRPLRFFLGILFNWKDDKYFGQDFKSIYLNQD